METEIWKDIIGYDGEYQVSNIGRVKSLKYGKERILKCYKSRYLQVQLSKNNKIGTHHIHTLVAVAFLNHKVGYNKVIDHIDHNQYNNRVENLRIVSQRENKSNLKGKKEGKYTSIYTGVNWFKKSKKWVSSILVNGEPKYLGLYSTEIEASNAYQRELKNINKNL